MQDTYDAGGTLPNNLMIIVCTVQNSASKGKFSISFSFTDGAGLRERRE